MVMKHQDAAFRRIVVLTAILLGFAAPAQACRYAGADIAGLVSGYKRTPPLFSNIAVVTVRWVSRSERAGWRADADIIKPLKGRLSYGFHFGRTAQTTCVMYPAPKEGDRWVVYFWRAPDGSEQEWAAHPLEKAAEFDPVYGTTMKSMLSKRR